MEGRRPRPRPAQDQARRLSGSDFFPAGSLGCLPFLCMQDLFKDLFDWYLRSLDSGGYWLVVLLMAIESSIGPLPSELVIPPAAIMAQRTGNMSLAGIVLAGAFGSWIGATAMYWASRWAGRPLVMRYGKYLFVPPAKVQEAE